MQLISGIFFALALILAVSLGGQTLDYTWGPALIVLSAALAAMIPRAWTSGKLDGGTAFAISIFAISVGWVLWRCSLGPVKEFARSDALLVAGTCAAFAWSFLAPAEGRALRVCMLVLVLLGTANFGISLYQLRDPSFAWPFRDRPTLFPSGLFGHYNHLADFSLVSVAFLGARLFFARDRRLERVVQALGLASSAGCVLVSSSRGGVISLCAVVMALAGLGALVAWRDKTPRRRMAAVVALSMPLLVAGIAVPALGRLQERRGVESGSAASFADNQYRLQMIGLAVDVTANHPWTGGGSRAFGWEKYHAWEPSESGVLPSDDDFVHNELLQVATDYGWIGAILVTAAVLAIGLRGVAGLATGEGGVARRAADAVSCGGLAAMTGTLLHSNFSFVTHTFPGALYLGLALGCALPRYRSEQAAAASPWPSISGAITAVALVLLTPLLAYAGGKGTMAYREAWPVFFGRERLATTAPGAAIDRMHAALEIWPSAEMAGDAAQLARRASQMKGLPDPERREKLSEAAELYAVARKWNPFDPAWSVNRANVLSALGRDQEAEAEFESAIALEGGMEGIFRARYYFARHLYGRWYRAWTRERRAGEALGGFLRARDLLREAETTTAAWVRGKEGRELLNGLEETISFLEGAKVKPEPVR